MKFDQLCATIAVYAAMIDNLDPGTLTDAQRDNALRMAGDCAALSSSLDVLLEALTELVGAADELRGPTH